MKTVLGLLIIWSPLALAANGRPLCESAYLATPFETCSDQSHGLEMNRQGEAQAPVEKWTAEVEGGQDQGRLCTKVRDSFNAENRSKGLFADLSSPTPIKEKSRDMGARVFRYSYLCSLTVMKYPFVSKPSAACGLKEAELAVLNVNSDVTAMAKEAQVSCLTCAQQSDLNNWASCTIGNVTRFMKAQNNPLSPEQVKILKSEVEKLLSYSRITPVRQLENIPTLNILNAFLQKHGQ